MGDFRCGFRQPVPPPWAPAILFGLAIAQPWDAFNTPEYRTASNAAVRTCFEDAGAVAEYTDMLPGSMLWPLRWAMTGICVILAALFLCVSAWRLKPAIAKR